MRRGKLVTVFALLAVIGAMTTLTAYAVPLYQAFCRITGYGGTTQVAERLPSRLIDRTERLARRTFLFSIVYLFLLFATLMAERLVGSLVS